MAEEVAKEAVTPIWEWIAKHASYIFDLKETLTSLKGEMEELQEIGEDVRLRLQVAEQHRMTPSNEVNGWLRRVGNVETLVDGIIQEGGLYVEYEHQNTSTRCGIWGCRCWSAYKLGKKATHSLRTVKELRSKRQFLEVANQQLLPPITTKIEGNYEMPMDNTVGIESMLLRVQECLKDDKLGIIGLYGMGGVGKTTLLKRINNELPKSEDNTFDLAIWVVASRQATVEGVQDDILEKLRIPPDEWRNKPVDVRSTLIYETMKIKRYVLMLDDIWDRLDLCEVGIPLPDSRNRCKVIFTCRSEEICGLMEAHQKFKVTCLPWEKAWALFQEKVGAATLSCHYEIPKLAELVAEKCDGLPIALITVGRAMATRQTPAEWEHALQVLKDNPSTFSGMGDRVLPIMKFSYDYLPNPTVQECFIYFSLFPEDYEIPTNKLVDLWIGEGLLTGFQDISEARNHGVYVIESLKRACLLESGSISHSRVKMHDVIYDMAAWIASNSGKHHKKVFDLKGESGFNQQDCDKEVKKMVLWGNKIHKPGLTSLCPALSTLIVNDTKIRSISSNLFQFIPSVRVLDLSGNSLLGHIPKEISTLRYLEYLDLSRTGISFLPELRSLSRSLRYLLLNYLENLMNFSTDIIYGLTNLRVFRMNYYPSDVVNHQKLLMALDSLQHINEISIFVDYRGTFSPMTEKLQRYARYLRLDGIKGGLVQLSPAKMKNLEALQIYASDIRSVEITDPKLNCFCNLRHVIISDCDSLEDLDCLVNAPLIEKLWVTNCKKLRWITHLHQDREAKHVFSSLKRIRLDDLPTLQYISGPLPFPCLERVYIHGCHGLGILPFNDMHGASRLEFIKGDLSWWRSLMWKNEDLEKHFRRYFQQWIEVDTVVEGRYGMVRYIKNAEWPMPETSLCHPDDYLTEERLHILRASMNIWEE